MTARLRPWVYSGGLLAVLALLALVPPLLQRTRFHYSASEIPAPTGAKLDMQTRLRSVTPRGLGPARTLAEIAGENPGGLLVNFWATWCPPCLDELPSLELLHRQLEAKGDPNLPRLVTLSVDDSEAPIVSLYKTLSFSPSFPVLLDTQGGLAQKVGSTRFPETYWVAADGTVRFKWLGPQNWVSDAVLRRLASP